MKVLKPCPRDEQMLSILALSLAETIVSCMTASGLDLDALGAQEWMGLPRNPEESDATYRERIIQRLGTCAPTNF